MPRPTSVSFTQLPSVHGVHPLGVDHGGVDRRRSYRSLTDVPASRMCTRTALRMKVGYVAGACFRFDFQSSITQRHLPAPTVRPKSAKCFYWTLFGDVRCRIRRTENPRVGSSILSLATNQIRVRSDHIGNELFRAHR